MIHAAQTTIQQEVSSNQHLANFENIGVQDSVKVNVLNQVGEEVNSYQISGNANEKLGDKLQSQNQIIQVLVNGKVMTLDQARQENFSQVGSTITVMENANMSVNASYNINGNNYAIGQTSDDIILHNGAKIYVPSNVLNNSNNKLTSVSINGTQYNGKIEGNYVIVDGDIPAISAQANNVVVNFQNNVASQKELANQKVYNTKADVQVMVMNQYGQQLSSTNISNANGQALLPIFSQITNPVESIQYNGSNVTLMDLLTQQYAPGTSNILTIVEHTQSPINVNAEFHGHNLNVPSYDTNKISSTGCSIKLPSGLAKHFKVDSITINGVAYQGKLQGDTYVVNAFIPEAVQYQTVFNLSHK